MTQNDIFEVDKVPTRVREKPEEFTRMLAIHSKNKLQQEQMNSEGDSEAEGKDAQRRLQHLGE